MYKALLSAAVEYCRDNGVDVALQIVALPPPVVSFNCRTPSLAAL